MGELGRVGLNSGRRGARAKQFSRHDSRYATKGERVKKWVLILCAASLLTGAAALWRWHGERDDRPEWKKRLATYPAPPLEGRVPYSNYTLRRHLWTDVLLRDEWDVEVVQELEAIVAAQPDDFMFRDDAPLEQIRAHRAARETIDVAAARLRSGGPIDAEARERIIDMMIRHSRKADIWSRLQATSVLVDSGLVDDGRVRARLEAMYSDPHPDVAANARRQLAAYQAWRATHGG